MHPNSAKSEELSHNISCPVPAWLYDGSALHRLKQQFESAHKSRACHSLNGCDGICLAFGQILYCILYSIYLAQKPEAALDSPICCGKLRLFLNQCIIVRYYTLFGKTEKKILNKEKIKKIILELHK